MLRRFYHVTDPWQLTLAQWDGLFKAMGEISAMESGTTDHASKAKQMRDLGQGKRQLAELREKWLKVT